MSQWFVVLWYSQLKLDLYFQVLNIQIFCDLQELVNSFSSFGIGIYMYKYIFEYIFLNFMIQVEQRGSNIGIWFVIVFFWFNWGRVCVIKGWRES